MVTLVARPRWPPVPVARANRPARYNVDHQPSAEGDTVAKEDLGDLSTATLEKRKTFATVILGIVVGVTALNVIVAVVAKRPELFAVAAAMFANGVHSFRRTPMFNSSRAPYCMMGVCFDCLVEIDGVPNRQACQVPVAEGMQVRRQQGTGEGYS